MMPDKFRRFESVEVTHKFRDGTSRLVSGHIVSRGENDGTWRVNLHTTPTIAAEFDEKDIVSVE